MEDLDRAVAGVDVDQLQERRPVSGALPLVFTPLPGCTEVGVDDQRVVADLLGRTAGDDAAVVEDVDVSHTPITRATSCSTRQMASSSFVGEPSQERAEGAGLLFGLTRRGLVEQKHLGLGHQGPCQLHDPGTAGREVGDVPVGDVAETRQLDDPFRLVVDADAWAPPPRVADLAGHVDVVPHRHGDEQLEPLEGPRQSELRSPVGRHAR